MTEGWVCPRCQLVLAPVITEHRCGQPGAGTVAWPVTPAPYNPWPGTVTVSPGVATPFTFSAGGYNTAGTTTTVTSLPLAA
jgi:hypothetical protein